jgi:hypothetical protein
VKLCVICLLFNPTMLCPDSEEQFEKTIEYLTEGFSGHRNLVKWQRKFHDYCNPKLKLMFINQFAKFIQENIRVFWGMDEIQVRKHPSPSLSLPHPTLFIIIFSLSSSMIFYPLTQLKFITYNIGRAYWLSKADKFVAVRDELGLTVV